MWTLLLSVSLVPGRLVAVGAAPAEKIDKLKDPCLETPLTVNGQPATAIVPGADSLLQDLARTLQAQIRKRIGVELPIVASDAVSDDLLREKHCIALGDCTSNRLIGRLYAMRLCFVDGVYPGKAQTNAGFDLDANGDGTPDLWSFSTPTGNTHAISLADNVSHSAPRSVHISGDESAGNARACVMRNLDLEPGRQYALAVWYRAEMPEGSRGLVHVDHYQTGSPNRQLAATDQALPPAGGWTEAGVEFTVPEGSDFSRVLLYLFGEGDIWFDDVSLTEADSDANLLSAGRPGAVVRTVHNPFGYGRNAIVLGASEAAGFDGAVRAFVGRLDSEPLPRLMEIELGDTVCMTGVVPVAGPDDGAVRRIAEGARTRIRSNAFVPVRDTMQGTKTYARNWYLTGDGRWARLYGAIWREILDAPPGNHAHGPMEWTFNTLEGWDLMDECPVLPDDLKLAVTNHLLKVGVRNEAAYGPNVQRTDRTIVDGHQLDQALCIYLHGLYFDRYYGINGHWKAIAEPLIQLGELAPRVHDSYAYGPIIGNDFMSEYALKTGDMDYFENGNCRLQAEWQMLCSDNLGAGGTFGDDGAWRGSVPKGLLYKANWYTRDDRLKWLLQGDRPPVGLFANNREAQEPEYLLGVAHIPLNERLYQVASTTRKDAEAQKWSPEMVPPEKAFDKLSLRTGFSQDDQYVLIDGIGVLSHGHQDGNSVLRFTDNGRLFLTEGHYVETTPRRHNTLIVSRNGEAWCPPPLTGLECKASLDTTGLVQTRLSAYNGVDWRRSILWKKEGFFAFIDQITAREEGHYGLELLWRSLGDVELSPSGRFTVDQMGQAMTITRADDARCSVRELLDYHGINYYGSYPHCSDGLVKILRQARSADLAPGQTVSYLNVVETHGAAERPAEVRELSDSALVVAADGARFIAGVGQPGFEGGPDTDARLWLASDGGLLSVADATRFAWGSLKIETEAPASVELDLAVGKAMADSAAPVECAIEVGAERTTARLAREPVAFELPGDGGLTGLFDRLEQAAAPPPANPAPAPADSPADAPRELWRIDLPRLPRLLTSEAGTRVHCAPEPLPHSTWTADYKIDPQTLAYQWDTIVLWREGEVAEVKVQLPQPRDISRIAVRTMRTDNSAMGIRYRLANLTISAGDTTNGPWTLLRTFEDTGDRIPDYPEYSVESEGLRARCIRVEAAPREGCAVFLKGIRAWGKPIADEVADPLIERWATGPVTAMCVARLTEAAADGVLCGYQDGALVALQQGKALWRAETGARVNALATGDLTGDRRPEILVGTNGQRLLCLDAQGEELWRREFPLFWGRPGNVMWVGVGDVDGDGDSKVVVSSEDWHYYCLDHEGNEVWRHEIQHSGLVGALGDINGDGKLETLCGEEYYGWDVLSSEGKRLSTVSPPAPVTTAALAADITGDDIPEAIFGGQSFGVYVRNGKGERVFDANVGGFVNDLAVLQTGNASLLVAAADNLDQNLAAFRPDGTPAWRVHLPGTPLVLATAGDLVAAGCADGVLRFIDESGKTVREARLTGPVAQVIAADVDGDGSSEICAASDRELVAFELTE